MLQPNLLEELMQYTGTELNEEYRRVILEETRCPLCETPFKTRWVQKWNRNITYSIKLAESNNFSKMQFNWRIPKTQATP